MTGQRPGLSTTAPGRRSPERLYREVAFVAYHFNWSHEAVLSMPHAERERWCAEISGINERMNGEG